MLKTSNSFMSGANSNSAKTKSHQSLIKLNSLGQQDLKDSKKNESEIDSNRSNPSASLDLSNKKEKRRKKRNSVTIKPENVNQSDTKKKEQLLTAEH